MKTNNVDFGKSFKFICQSDNGTVYTCHKANKAKVCKVSWEKSYEGDEGNTTYPIHNIEKNIKEGSWIVLPNVTLKEDVTSLLIQTDLLNEIKSFTTTSKHSVNIYNGAYEVFRSGEDMAYQCKDDETLKSVMQALKVLDSVLVDE